MLFCVVYRFAPKSFAGRFLREAHDVSRKEKYQGALYKPKGNTKMKPQEIWMNAVAAVTSGLY